ncbi:MAG: hypothetical protein PHE88_12385 [Elusimicrobia bacterium]|nr:hypothetical protein [Elusimicrobiota bacterium]
MGIQDKYMHKATYLPTSTLFEAVFNAVIPGRYDFVGTIACQNVPVMELQTGYVYWVRRLSVGGNIPQEDYLGSIVDFPLLTVRRTVRTGVAVYTYPLPIDKYVDNGDCDAWILSDQKGDFLTLSLSGSCIQLPAMIGVASIRLRISLSIYGICDTGFSSQFRSQVCQFR